MRCVVEEMQGWVPIFWNDVVSQLLSVAFHRDYVDGDVQSLRQSRDVHMITLHRHSLHFLNEEKRF